MKKILLHACCAPCASYVILELKKRGFRVTAFFYNPNIFPKREYEIRKNEIKKYCEENKIEFVEEKESYENWKEKILCHFDPSLLTKGEGEEIPLNTVKCHFTKSTRSSHPDLFHSSGLGMVCKEGGCRCEMCYKIRLEKTAKFAIQNNFQYFDSTLSISPHKNFEKIKKIVDELFEKYNIKFYGENWKKSDGFKKACELSQQHNFYRQNYCGCEFSRQTTNN